MAQDSDQGAAAMESSPGRAVAPSVSVSAASGLTVGGVATLASVLVAFALLALALVFLQYYFSAGGDDRARTSTRGQRRGGRVAAARDRGVYPEVLRSMPVTVYRAAKKGSGEEGLECAVCLAELEDGEEARFLPRCGHGFHAECIDLWLASHSTCPLCRLTVGKPDVSQSQATLPPVPSETANYAVNLPASVLLGLSDMQGALTAQAVTTTDNAGPSPSAAATAMLVIEIPESTEAAATPRDAARSPGSARLRSLRRLWSFGRQGPAGSTTPSCSFGVLGEGADIEHGIGVRVDMRAVGAPPLPPEAATPRAAA